MNPAVYINGTRCISVQDTFDRNWFFGEIRNPGKNFLQVSEDAFKNAIAANLSRRMSKMVRMGVASAMSAMNDAAIEKLSAIIVGTGNGCFEDSLKFLKSMIENEEKLLSPATFIQSTHNTVAAQIALLLKCYAYNFTYVHRGFSFENALQDAVSQIAEDKNKNILVGGVDEIPAAYLELIDSAGWLKKQADAENYFSNDTGGVIAGEGSSFFILSGIKSLSSYAQLKEIRTIYNPSDTGELRLTIEKFLSDSQLQLSSIDTVILGLSGDAQSDNKIKFLGENYFKNNLQLSFKNYFGESPIAVSFALWMAAVMIRKKEIPEALCMNNVRRKEPENILVFNQYRDKNYSLILLSKC
ncbi:MAG TPA: beta-ketoacyl synthase N-terminal-like domain-containing protein [Bacteroidia bacterium]|nr:beta-ketoacyl synthase N-terminal-like domain-containing protein [Bacteroidia bacterium]